MLIRDYTRRDNFVNAAINIANDDSRGYDQARRWPEQGPDLDCSSLVYTCAYIAGYDNLNRNNPRYTGSMVGDFTRAGWTAVAFDGNLRDLDPGDVLLNIMNHTAIYIGDGRLVEASINEKGGITGGQPGDQTGNEIHIANVYNYPWDTVLLPPEDYVEVPTPEPQHMRHGILWEYHGGDNQKFNLIHNDDGTVTLIDNMYGLAMDLSKGQAFDCNKVNFFTPNGHDAQKWYCWEIIGPSKPASVAPHILASKVDQRFILDGAMDGNGQNGTELIVYENRMLNDNMNQIWYIEDNLDGTWCIRSSRWPKLVVDVSEEIPFQ